MIAKEVRRLLKYHDCYLRVSIVSNKTVYFPIPKKHIREALSGVKSDVEVNASLENGNLIFYPSKEWG